MATTMRAQRFYADTKKVVLKDIPRGAPQLIPVGRLGRPGEVADVAVAMLSNAYLTDKVVTLDGGLIPR